MAQPLDPSSRYMISCYCILKDGTFHYSLISLSKGNRETSTKLSRESKAATLSTSKEAKTQETKKETHPLRLCSSSLHNNPQAPTGASSAQTHPGEIPPHAYQESFNTHVVLQHFHGSSYHMRTHHFKQRLELHSLSFQ
ncbi:hypothetical protein CRG98_030590 [Punica granatum]|uniref:Uncharacterized protein n=1 Tax=Punica granatum TaxID=22663 RepID=A0A2I0IZ39_PUNGR|nr:hypothetical protein CRG98_030590 [Punica granatum]